jgi:hypothetical protein
MNKLAKRKKTTHPQAETRDYFLTFVHFPRKTNATLGFIKDMIRKLEPL